MPSRNINFQCCQNIIENVNELTNVVQECAQELNIGTVGDSVDQRVKEEEKKAKDAQEETTQIKKKLNELFPNVDSDTWDTVFIIILVVLAIIILGFISYRLFRKKGGS